MVERYALEPDAAGELLLRSVPEPWPFPPPLRVVPELVAAVDLADGPALEPVEFGRVRLVELTADLDPLWRRRSRRGASVRPLIPTQPIARRGARLQMLAAREDIWDDRAERDARGLVALLFVAGGRLRRRASVYLVPWVIQRDPRFFDAPEAFVPTRWLDGLARRLPRFAYFPFGGGPRLCIGQQFALMEAVIVLSSIVQCWRLELVPRQDLRLETALTPRPRHGLRMRLEAR